MRRSYSRSILSCLALLCGLQRGESQFTVTTDPESGSTVADFPETENIVLTCQLRNQDGSSRITSWSRQTALDRDEGKERVPISNGDSRFLLSGEIFQSSLGNISDSRNLTVLSLTEDLDTAIIFCGVDAPKANFTLRIYYPPVLSERGEVRRRENEELNVDMAEPGSPQAFPFPSQVSWTKDGEEVEGASSTRVFNYSSIFIGSVEPSDSGVYLLSATNYLLNGSLLRTDSASLTLNVLFGAGLGGAGSVSVPVLEGEPATLVCGTDLTGNPTPTITWTDNTGSVVSEGGRVSLSSGREEVSLTLATSTREDDGNWSCSAQVYESDTLTVGQPVQRTIQLVVVVAPVAPVDLSAKELGSTWIYLQWFQPSAGQGNPPLSGHVITVQEVGGGEEERRFDGGSAEANVTDLLPGTEYTFSVVAVSEFGELQAPSPASVSANGTTTLTVPAPVCSEPPQVAGDRLVVSWTYTHTGGLPITSAMVFFSPESTCSRASFSSVPGAQLSSLEEREREDSIPLPEAGLTYQISVVAGNSQGEREADCPTILLTTGIPARPNPPLVVVSADGSVSITVATPHSGVRDNSVDQFQFITQIFLSCSNQLHIEVSQGESCSSGVCAGSVTLASGGEEGLEQGTTYIVSVKASNRYGVSQVSNNSDPFTIGAPDPESSSDSTFSEGVGVGFALGVVTTTLGFAAVAIVITLILKWKAREKAMMMKANLAYELHSTTPPHRDQHSQQTQPTALYEEIGKL